MKLWLLRSAFSSFYLFHRRLTLKTRIYERMQWTLFGCLGGRRKKVVRVCGVGGRREKASEQRDRFCDSSGIGLGLKRDFHLLAALSTVNFEIDSWQQSHTGNFSPSRPEAFPSCKYKLTSFLHSPALHLTRVQGAEKRKISTKRQSFTLTEFRACFFSAQLALYADWRV